MAGRRRPRRLGGVRLVGAACPGEPSELTDDREALPARRHLLHLLPGFSPHEQGERAGGRDCAWAASRAVHVTEAAPGCLVRTGTARKPILSPLPGTSFPTWRIVFKRRMWPCVRKASGSISNTHLHSQLLEGVGWRMRASRSSSATLRV